MRKILKALKYLLILLIFFSIYEFTSIDNRYVNRSTVDIDINNVRNPPLKKLARKLDLYVGSFYFNLSKKKEMNFSIKILKNIIVYLMK